MKKKLLIITAVISLIAVLLLGFVAVIANKGYGLSQGRYLEAKNGQPMLILDNSPIQLSDRKDRISFERFDIGDEILVLHDGIEESYPGKTGVYAVFKLRDGTADDIPQTVIDTLAELGWLEANTEHSEATEEETSVPASSAESEKINCVINAIDGNHFIVEELEDGKRSGMTYQFNYNSGQLSVGDEITVEFRYPITNTVPYGLTDVTVYKDEQPNNN